MVADHGICQHVYMKKKELFNRVVDNAFDFLESAIDQFDTKSKYSVIHFSSAIELILKARLMHEHWSLIVSSAPDKKKFEAGDFQSIKVKDSIEKIRKVLGEDFPTDIEQSFLGIAQHRNKTETYDK